MMTAIAWTAICLTAFFTLSLVGAACDVRSRRVPNLLFAAIILAWVAWRFGCMCSGWVAGNDILLASEVARSLALLLQSALAYILLLFAIHLGERATSRFMMGGADLKFMAACVAFLGLEGALAIMALGCAVGVLYPAIDAIARKPLRGVPLVASTASVLPLAAFIC